VPRHEDQGLFEMLVLEGAQAGLNWETILRKREGYRDAFDGFGINAVAAYGDDDVERLLADPGIIRNRLKIRAAIDNARTVCRLQEQYGSFDAYIWRFVDHQPRVNTWTALEEVPAQTPESETMSKELKRAGCRFVGPTICYAFMQATGLVNDHLVGCFRHRQLG
jgi:DNA-3-methyladenine glycosylase I